MTEYPGALDRVTLGREYASHLTDADLALVASVAQGGRGQPSGPAAPAASFLRADPAALLRLLEHPAVFNAVIVPGDAGHGWAVTVADRHLLLPGQPWFVQPGA